MLESCAAVFLLLSILRPVFKGLWDLKGLALLPLLSLGILAGIFPAYGFRPECIPLLVFAFFLVMMNFGAFFSLFTGLQNEDYRERGPVFTLACLAVFGFFAWAAWEYSPPLDMELDSGAESLALLDGARKEELWVRFYAPAVEGPRPLILVIPPVSGSIPVIDAVCGALRDKGWAVLTYSRPGFDSPALAENGTFRRLSLSGLYRLFRALVWGRTDAAANADGITLEEGRRQDVEFLLKELSRNALLRERLAGAGEDGIFLAGYGAGGAALTGLAASSEWIAENRVKAIIAIESPILSSLETETPPSRTGGPFAALFPVKITGIGAVPRPEIPVLFIVSDRLLSERAARYETILKTAQSSTAPVLVAALFGAGPFDYSDSPRLYPAFRFLFPGEQKEAAREAFEYPLFTASLISNFAALVLDPAGADKTAGPGEAAAAGSAPAGPAAGEPAPETEEGGVPRGGKPQKTALSGVYLEPGGIWNLGDVRSILQP